MGDCPAEINGTVERQNRMNRQGSPTSDVIREALSMLRSKVRVPLHQIISYAEIMIEESEAEDHPVVTAVLSQIIGQAKSVLQLASRFQMENDCVESAIVDLCQRFAG